jgi:flavin-dependent dehydrogenase
MSDSYDAIVVGARCGGSPTAMLLARKGYRVLLADRSSTASYHASCPSLTRKRKMKSRVVLLSASPL